ASLSQLPASLPNGIGTGSNAISATRHWCGLRRIASWIDSGVPKLKSPNGPSGLLNGTVSGNTFSNGWLMSSQQPKKRSDSPPPLGPKLCTFAGSVCCAMLVVSVSTGGAAKKGIVMYSKLRMPGSAIGWQSGLLLARRYDV